MSLAWQIVAGYIVVGALVVALVVAADFVIQHVHRRRVDTANARIRERWEAGFADGHHDRLTGAVRYYWEDPPVDYSPAWPFWRREQAVEENRRRAWRAGWVRGYAAASLERVEAQFAARAAAEAATGIVEVEAYANGDGR